jgi:hypothetical protein
MPEAENGLDVIRGDVPLARYISTIRASGGSSRGCRSRDGRSLMCAGSGPPAVLISTPKLPNARAVEEPQRRRTQAEA